MNTAVYLIHAGGTFGSHGTPLSPLSADEFLPILQAHCRIKLPNIDIATLSNKIIKDSSTLTPSDFVQLYGLILQAYAKGGRKFVLITGTDTLSFLAAFLAHALKDLTDLSLVITGSMQPLLISDEAVYTIDDHSDAWMNLAASISDAMAHTGVFVQFAEKLMDALDTQKINNQDHDAFIGKVITHKKTNQSVFNEAFKYNSPHHTINDKLAQLPTLLNHAKHTQITAIYCLPNDVKNLEHQLTQLHDDTKAVILIAFGKGNLPSSQTLKQLLKELQAKKVMVICTTMCAFGGISTDYAAGSWQYQYGVQASHLGIAGTYGKTLWQVLQ